MRPRRAAAALLLPAVIGLMGLMAGSPGAAVDDTAARLLERQGPLGKARGLVRQHEYEAARRAYAKLQESGACAGAVCAAGLAILAHRRGEEAEAVARAREAARLAGEVPPLDAWECNELAVLLYGAAKGDPEVLADAESLLRRGYSPRIRPSNMGLNLVSVLELMGRKDEAAAINREIEAAGGPIIDSSYALIGEFQGPGVIRD